jgi:hypothetical protein
VGSEITAGKCRQAATEQMYHASGPRPSALMLINSAGKWTLTLKPRGEKPGCAGQIAQAIRLSSNDGGYRPRKRAQRYSPWNGMMGNQ